MRRGRPWPTVQPVSMTGRPGDIGVECALTRRAFQAMALLGINAAFTHAVEPGKPSKTAVVTLQLRALGARLPAPELRNPDNLAARLLGAEERALLREMPMGEVYADMDFATAWRKMPEIQHRVFLHVLARTRFFDDALHRAKALRDGASAA